jgi:acyl-CoA synthetase (AMP-forming)/AMP-acid ligase II
VLNDTRLTFADAESLSAKWAKGLLAFGMGKGSRIGLLMPNGPDWVTAFFASSRIGALTVALSTFYQAPEISWGLAHNDIDTLLISSSYLSHDYIERLERAIPELAGQRSSQLHLPSHPYLRRIVVWGKCDRPWAINGPDGLESAAGGKPAINDELLRGIEGRVAPADALVVICTSGSTAEPKAVVHTHGTALRAVHLFTHYIDLRPDDRSYSGQAFFWIGGLNMNLLPSIFMGACIVFSETPASADVANAVLQENVTRLSLWPAQAKALVDHAAAAGFSYRSIRIGLGEPRDERGNLIPPDRRHGSCLGMTESFGMHSIEPMYSWAPPGKGGNWGRHLPGVERRVVDPQTGRALAPGETGELQIRGHTLMQCYYKREREETFLADGFFATGDFASIDRDDYLYFHGRMSEMIKTAGANVSPAEVERVLAALPTVREAIVFGVDHAVKGEIVAACVVPTEGSALDPGELRESLRTELSSYKVPREIRIIAYEDIPRTGSLKPVKAKLKAMLFGAKSADDSEDEG